MKLIVEVFSSPFTAINLTTRPRLNSVPSACMAHMFQTLVLVDLLTLSAMFSPLHAQILWEPETGVLVRNFNEPDPCIVLPGPNPGEGLIVWSDARTGSDDLYGQLMDATGNPMWEEDGRPLITAPRNQIETCGIAIDDGWVLLWYDDSGPGYDYGYGALYMQRFDWNGTPLWSAPPLDPEEGVLFFPDNRISADATLLADSEGGLFVAAIVDLEQSEYGTIRLHRILLDDGSRDPNWPDEGVFIDERPYTDARGYDPIELLPAAESGVVVCWDNGYGQFAYSVGTDGEFLWESGIRLNNDWSEVQFCTDGDGGFYIAGSDHFTNGHGDPFSHVLFNHVLADGSVPWGDDGVQINQATRSGPRLESLTPSINGTAIVSYRENAYGGWLRAIRLGGDAIPQQFWGYA